MSQNRNFQTLILFYRCKSNI